MACQEHYVTHVNTLSKNKHHLLCLFILEPEMKTMVNRNLFNYETKELWGGRGVSKLTTSDPVYLELNALARYARTGH